MKKPDRKHEEWLINRAAQTVTRVLFGEHESNPDPELVALCKVARTVLGTVNQVDSGLPLG